MQWRAIPGYEGTYEVSNTGRVRSVDRTITFSDGRVRFYAGEEKSQYLADGYWKVTLNHNRLHVHVLVAAAFLGPRPEGMEVCHNDGDRQNAKRSNLRYGTRASNHADKLKHGTQPHGETHHASKVSLAIVRNIRKAKGTVTETAARFGVSRTTAHNIRHFKRWKHAA